MSTQPLQLRFICLDISFQIKDQRFQISRKVFKNTTWIYTKFLNHTAILTNYMYLAKPKSKQSIILRLHLINPHANLSIELAYTFSERKQLQFSL